jgi:hypothetical protein
MTGVTLDENGVVIAKADPMRVSLIMQCTSAQNVTVGINSPLAVGSGYILSTSMMPWELTIADHGYLVQVEWRAIVPAATTGKVVVTEVKLSKWVEENSVNAVTPADVRRAAVAYGRALALMKGGQRAS